jgi:tryptophan synthase beta subunit
LSQVEIDYVLNLQIEDATYSDLRKLEMTMMRTFSLLNRLFPDSPVSKIVQELQRVIMFARQAQLAIRATQAAYAAYMAGTLGPVGAAYAVVSIASVALSGYESTVGTC